MKNFKGTPGPWHVSNEGCMFIRDNADLSIVAKYVGYTNDEEELSNAKLIAASPTLLSALQHLVEVYDSEDGKQWTTTSKRAAIAEARAAIDKALGE